MKTILAKNLMCKIAGNVNTPVITDKQFREVIRISVNICQEVIEWREAIVQLG